MNAVVGDRCTECAFDWSGTFDQTRQVIADAAQTYIDLFRVETGPLSSSEGVWSPREYLWHVVDVLRFGTERLWTLELDIASGLMPWDERLALSVREASPLSVPVGLRALERGAAWWLQAAEAAPHDVTVDHPQFGPMDLHLMARRNAHEVMHHAMDIARGLTGR